MHVDRSTFVRSYDLIYFPNINKMKRWGGDLWIGKPKEHKKYKDEYRNTEEKNNMTQNGDWQTRRVWQRIRENRINEVEYKRNTGEW